MINFESSDQSQGSFVKFLVYGPAGVGKTVLSATMPTPILISAEAGTLSLRKKNIEKLFGVGTQGISYEFPTVRVSTVDDIKDIYNWLTQSHEANQYQSVCLDSLSEIGEVVLNNAKRLVKDPRMAYGEMIEKMETLIRLFRDLPTKHVYMTAKMDSAKDGMTGMIKYAPSMPGAKLGEKLPYFFDEVFRLGTNKDQNGQDYRFLQTQPDNQYVAKDRSGSLDAVEYPHLGALIAKISN